MAYSDDDILAAVRAIPPGHVTTYGDLCPGAPRKAGAVLAANEDPALPWQRVVRADGSLAKGERQRALLEAEGVPFRGRAGGHARGVGARGPRLSPQRYFSRWNCRLYEALRPAPALPSPIAT